MFVWIANTSSTLSVCRDGFKSRKYVLTAKAKLGDRWSVYIIGRAKGFIRSFRGLIGAKSSCMGG